MVIDFSRNYYLTSAIANITIGEQVVERVEQANMLGVTMSNNLSITLSAKPVSRFEFTDELSL